MTSGIPPLFDDIRRAAYDLFGEIQEGLRPTEDGGPSDPVQDAPPVPPVPDSVAQAAARATEELWASALDAARRGYDAGTGDLGTALDRERVETARLRDEVRGLTDQVARLRASLQQAHQSVGEARAAQAKAEGIAAGLREAHELTGGRRPAEGL